MSKKDLDVLYVNPNTPKNLRITICLCAYLCELLSMVAQTWLYLDIDFLQLRLDFELNMKYDKTLLFGVSMVGSLLHLLSTPIPLGSVSDLQRMVNH